jgi:2',3'-cyclic-nucleotide 2'-phosphodiesterase (5'-nucleotidase family)
MLMALLSSWHAPFSASLLAVALAGTPASTAAPDRTNTLVILSTTDMKAKTSPCGCHIPKGGLSRQASFADSIRSEYPNVMVVDNGGFFPDDTLHREFVPFMMDQMKRIHVAAAGLGDRDLRFGADYVKSQVARSGLPVVCANLTDRKSRATVVQPYLIQRVGAAKVGVFGLISDKVDLGPDRDLLAAAEPQATAKRIVAELRKKGATVVVLLSQLGKVESEDLVTMVDGIDVVIVGRNVPMLQVGRQIKNTVACYGGEQGQYMGRTLLGIDAKGNVTSRGNEVFMLGPDVGERADIQTTVKAFEDAFNEKFAKQQKEDAARVMAGGNEAPDRYVGSEVCQRCHAAETEQWKTTAHSHAFQTLVDQKKDATPDCVPCHTVGFQKPGGFTSASATPRMVNVGCENCHGMGSMHEAMAANPSHVTEATCRTCHNSTTSPTFDFATYSPHVIHGFKGTLPELPKRQTSMMKGASPH